MFGKSNSSADSKEGGLDQSCKVEELSGLRVENIVVCFEFGAALSADNNLYMWGHDVGSNQTEVFKLAIQGYSKNSFCYKCSWPLVDSWQGWLSWCTRCLHAQNALSTLPHPWGDNSGVTSQINIGLCYAITPFRPQAPNVYCNKCGKYWNKYGAGLKLNKDLCLMYCKSCSAIIDGRWYNFLAPLTDIAPHKVIIDENQCISDIAAGKNFVLIKTPSKLFIWGEINGIRYNNLLLTLDDMINSKISCGANLITVVSSSGELYLFGVADNPSKGEITPMIMKKVPLKSPAVDVACGCSSVVCLLENGTFEFIGNVAKMITRGNCADEVTLISIPSFFNETLMESAMNSLLHPYKKRPVVLCGEHTDVFIYIHGLGAKTTKEVPIHQCTDASIQNKQESVDKETLTDLQSTPPSSSIYRELFGKSFLSDVSIKLSDGIFPAHRLVLYYASVYFRELFTDWSDSRSTGVLDMTSYNGKAYRALLTYFYRVPLGELSYEDLIDLYLIASSYNEIWITKDVFERIVYAMDDSNVLFFYKKAKDANISELLEECRIFMGADPLASTSAVQ
ncbi:hypothetical protein GE061_017851 [Apolygus lucorum]|uniref:BTB domain-containing protein n=1 Tax=Apolygus lucorum TaxID=248454 RepID=A0A8S9XG67_APOLU|nr:hypothetical protein GE061_017851 [Apolygus lucorum]